MMRGVNSATKQSQLSSPKFFIGDQLDSRLEIAGMTVTDGDTQL